MHIYIVFIDSVFIDRLFLCTQYHNCSMFHVPSLTHSLTQTVDGLSTSNESVPYEVPAMSALTGTVTSCSNSTIHNNGSFALRFSLPGTSVCYSIDFILDVTCLTDLFNRKYMPMAYYKQKEWR